MAMEPESPAGAAASASASGWATATAFSDATRQRSSASKAAATAPVASHPAPCSPARKCGGSPGAAARSTGASLPSTACSGVEKDVARRRASMAAMPRRRRVARTTRAADASTSADVSSCGASMNCATGESTPVGALDCQWRHRRNARMTEITLLAAAAVDAAAEAPASPGPTSVADRASMGRGDDGADSSPPLPTREPRASAWWRVPLRTRVTPSAPSVEPCRDHDGRAPAATVADLARRRPGEAGRAPPRPPRRTPRGGSEPSSLPSIGAAPRAGMTVSRNRARRMSSFAARWKALRRFLPPAVDGDGAGGGATALLSSSPSPSPLSSSLAPAVVAVPFAARTAFRCSCSCSFSAAASAWTSNGKPSTCRSWRASPCVHGAM